QQKRRGLDFTLPQQLSPAWKLSTGYSYVKIQSKSSATAAYVNDAGNTQPNGYRLNLEYSQDKWDAGLMLRGSTGRDLSTF
ncbi:TonB-dependent receptor, partial [Klebsiella pneumoniae]|nr:TonB-dependent receptor [Klebsiella pneumoniae]MCP6663769.1 TonB-dependent receptor [Klebsiella pneumoniae]